MSAHLGIHSLPRFPFSSTVYARGQQDRGPLGSRIFLLSNFPDAFKALRLQAKVAEEVDSRVEPIIRKGNPSARLFLMPLSPVRSAWPLLQSLLFLRLSKQARLDAKQAAAASVLPIMLFSHRLHRGILVHMRRGWVPS